jgi:hypothetical protein
MTFVTRMSSMTCMTCITIMTTCGCPEKDTGRMLWNAAAAGQNHAAISRNLGWPTGGQLGAGDVSPAGLE